MKPYLGRIPFLRHALTLMAGTILAQLLPLITAPLMSRLYTPAEFGAFAIFTVAATLLSTVVTGRYESAIVLPETNREAITVLALVIGVALTLSSACFLFLVLLSSFSSFDPSAAGHLLLFVPAATVGIASYQALYCWLNRGSHYRPMAAAMVAQNVAMVLSSLGLAYCGAGAHGLAGGYVFGKAVGVGALLFAAWPSLVQNRRYLRVRRMRRSAVRYANFPRYSAPASLVNMAARQMPILLLTAFFDATVVGMYSLNQRVFAAPAGLIAKTVGDVYCQRASVEFTKFQHCLTSYRSTFWLLLLTSLPVFLVLLAAGPQLFTFVFGAEWELAGLFAQVQSPLLLLGLIASPLSVTFHIAQKQKHELSWQIGLLVAVSICTFAGCLSTQPLLAVGGFASAYCFMYILYLGMSYHFAKPKILNGAPDAYPAGTGAIA